MVEKGLWAHCVDNRERLRGVERMRFLRDIMTAVMMG